MANLIADTVLKSIEQVDALYHRLILIVALSGTGKTAALQTVHSRTGSRLINVNLELSRQLLDLSERQRALQLPRQLSDIVNAVPADLVLLDNIELLFDPLLKQDPLRLLQGISRNKTLVVAWNGSIIDEHIVYATPDHAEYKRYQPNGIIVINAMNLS